MRLRVTANYERVLNKSINCYSNRKKIKP